MQRILACVGILVAGYLSAAALAVVPARAEECPGHPDALGTSRTLTIDSAALPRVGRMQYPESLPLADKEVVLTFDDGPHPRYSNEVLDVLAAQCVKATFFLIGSNAREHPAVVRRIFAEGHSIGTHTENHPRMRTLSVERVREEIDDGIADVTAALGDQSELAPFFRIPGLERSDMIEAELAARSLIVFSTDVVADDWFHHISPQDIVRRAMSRLQARGKGILLLHDIHAATAAALPLLLAALKADGFHIVHVVPSTAGTIAVVDATGSIAPEAAEMAQAKEAGSQASAIWPEIAAAQPDDAIALPAPDVTSFATAYRPGHRVVAEDGTTSAGYFALAAAASADNAGSELGENDVELPAPDLEDVGLPLLGWAQQERKLRMGANLRSNGEPLIRRTFDPIAGVKRAL
jgi:peptidoglycan/xylan/chitin deacetylase (PgdA/CDA1 family)